MKENINCGEFTTSVDIYKPEKVRTKSGAVSRVYTLAGTILAKSTPRTIEEQTDTMKLELASVIELTTYIYKEITNSWRVQIKGVDHEIITVKELNRTYMRIIAKKI